MKKAYDLEKVYDDKIFPLMQQIIDICRANDIPFVADFQYATDGEDDYAKCSSAWLPKSRHIDPGLEAAYNLIKPKRSRPLNITVRDKDGNATEMITILG